MNREEHLLWCKERALAYLPSDPGQAFTSMASDLRKHPDTANHPAVRLGMMLLMSGNLDTPEKTRKFIKGFK